MSPRPNTARFLLALVCLWLAACSSQGPRTTQGGDHHAVRFALYDQFGEWRGVPYRMGGLSKSGVDCSGLVYLTFRDRFGIQLPRNTADLARAGDTVKPRDRRSGDLVLFRIHRGLNHVGIYLEEGRFMHASASSGVMISSLADPYWQQRYWKTVRPRSSLLAGR
ncbi:MAG: NlpC/P60 family protein [Porticoccaceae bacterium]|jgi:probable lipoprotein NlpC|nr:NlpC/P60 family protein [Porticoccaceae bacterium]